MKNLHIILILMLIMAPSIAHSQQLTVEEHGFSGHWFPVDDPSAPVIFAVGGSEGGHVFGRQMAPWLNEAGYHVLSLAYFGYDGLPDILEEIELGFLESAFEWLDGLDGMRAPKVGLLGVSKGAEVSLVQASRIDRFGAVVAISPSSVVWQSIKQPDQYGPKSSWKADGMPLPFVPYCFDRGFDSIFNFYDCAFDNFTNDEAVIMVEKINAPILLLSGDDDNLWPSYRMSRLIVGRLDAFDFPHEALHVNIPGAGHWLLAPYMSNDPDNPQLQNQQTFDFLGGSGKEMLKVSAKSESVILEFFGRHLMGAGGNFE